MSFRFVESAALGRVFESHFIPWKHSTTVSAQWTEIAMRDAQLLKPIAGVIDRSLDKALTGVQEMNSTLAHAAALTLTQCLGGSFS